MEKYLLFTWLSWCLFESDLEWFALELSVKEVVWLEGDTNVQERKKGDPHHYFTTYIT